MKERALTAFLIILGAIPLFFSLEYLYLIIILAAFIISLELNDLVSDEKYPLIIGLNFAMIISVGLDFIASRDKLIVFGIFLLVFVLFDLIYNDIGFNNLSLIYTVSMLVGFALNAFVSLYNISGLLIWYILIVNYGSDTGAYLIGSRFGKTKLIPHISPNKTVEGAIGGIVLGGILGAIFGYFVLKIRVVPLLIIVSFAMPIVGQLGDLFFSSLKRSYKRKDFGSIFPGHGGVLDRIDSLVFSLVFVVIFLRLGYMGIGF